MNDHRLRTLLLLLLVLAVYVPALTGGFVWDDDDHLTENPYVAVTSGLRDIWSSLHASRYYPLTLTTFWAFRQLFGLNPLPYHLLNVLLHAGNVCLFWLVLRRLQVRGAWAAAALWAVHPVMVESVAWVTELKNTQSTLFLLLSLWCWLDFDETGRRDRYGWALVAFAAALASKPATVMLPVVLLLCVWWRRGEWRWADVRWMLPFFALSAGMSLLTIIEQQRMVVGAGTTEWQLSLADRWMVAGRAAWFYVGKLLWPVNLTFVYPRWTEFIAGPAVALVVVLAGLWLLRRQTWARAGLFGATSFLVLLAPVMGFFNIYYFRYSFVADHFNYLPATAFLALIPAAVMTVVRDSRWQVAATVAGVTVLGALTWQQAGIYQQRRTLWEDTLAKNPSCWMARNNLGTTLAREGRHAEAIAQYRTALRLKPDFPDPYNNLGNQFARQGQTDAALAAYTAALRIQPTYNLARFNLAVALTSLGRTNEAMQQYQTIIGINPGDADAHYNLGLAHARQGELEPAAAHFAAALRARRDFPEAAHNLALARRKLGERPSR